MAEKSEAIELSVAGKQVRVSNPSKPYFSEAGLTKLDLVQYYPELSQRHEGQGQGRRALAAALRKTRRRAEACGAVPG